MSSYARRSPSNGPAEKHLLGAILIEPEAIARVSSRLTAEDFFVPKHAEIWRAMMKQFELGLPIDLASLAPYMLHEEQSSSYLAGLMQGTGGAQNIEYHADSIKAASRRRAVLAALGQMAAAVYEENDPGIAESMAKEILLEAIERNDGTGSIISPSAQGEILRTLIETKSIDTPSGIMTGYPVFDATLGGGLRRGDLIVLAARTGIGKSTLAENIAEGVAKRNHIVLFCSLEMTPEQLMYRYAVRSGLLSRSALEYGLEDDGDRTALDKLVSLRAQLPFHLMNDPDATTIAVRSAASRLRMQEGGLDLIVVDYLQLLWDRNKEEERLRIGEITRSLKMVAREFHVPVILISQLNRNIEHRGGEPQLSDLRESGRIEEDADLVLMLWALPTADTLGNVTKAKIVKNRQGPKEELPFVFHQPSFTFSEKQ